MPPNLFCLLGVAVVKAVDDVLSDVILLVGIEDGGLIQDQVELLILVVFSQEVVETVLKCLEEVGLLLCQLIAQASLQGNTVVALLLESGHGSLVLLFAGEPIVLQLRLNTVVRALQLLVLVAEHVRSVGTHLLQRVFHHLGILVMLSE